MLGGKGPNQVYATVDLSEATVIESGRDLLARDAELDELSPRRTVVLPPGQRRNRAICRSSDPFSLHSTFNPTLDLRAPPSDH